MDTNIRSFKEWSNLGYRIKKGAKALPHSPYGRPMFNATQVEKIVPPQTDDPVTSLAIKQMKSFDFTRTPQHR